MGPQYVERSFGSHGCLETLTNLRMLGPRAGRARAERREGSVPALFDAAQGGDQRARKAIAEVAKLMGIAAANLSLVIDPSLLVLGGDFVAQGEPLVSEVRRVIARILPAPLQVAVSALGKEAPLWGTLLLATSEARRRLKQELRATHARV